jgi:hypothetical protein
MFSHLKCLHGQHNIVIGNMLAASSRLSGPCVNESTICIIKKKENSFRGSIKTSVALIEKISCVVYPVILSAKMERA